MSFQAGSSVRSVNSFSVENRSARMHQKPARSLRPALDYDNRFDRQFESQLPPEVRAELEIPLRSTPRPPVRIPETEQEIAQALEWLKSQGYLRPASPAPPSPVSPPQPPAVFGERFSSALGADSRTDVLIQRDLSSAKEETKSAGQVNNPRLKPWPRDCVTPRARLSAI
jgi:hypothetical protein